MAPLDIDKDDKDNPQLVSEYVNEIYDYMRALERKLGVKEKYLEGKDINVRMRGILVDWLVQVSYEIPLAAGDTIPHNWHHRQILTGTRGFP